MMMKNQDRVGMVKEFYEKINEDMRLEKSRQGQLEYFVTMHYIHKFAKKGDLILEIGAGTGKYSVALAGEGFQVSAVELVEKNLKELRNNAKDLTNLVAYQGDALDLRRFEEGSFDITLSFGPMYHLYDEKDQQGALDEAIRVTKSGGIILIAFLSAHAILCTNYLYDYLPTAVGIKNNFDSDYRVKHFKEQLFTGFDICEFEELFSGKDVDYIISTKLSLRQNRLGFAKCLDTAHTNLNLRLRLDFAKCSHYITTVAVDNVLEIAESRPDFAMTDEDFRAFADYQLHICEKREMLGNSSHLLYICRKK